MQDDHCIQEEIIGELKAFMRASTGLKANLFALVVVIVVQVGTFLWLWGGLTVTVNRDSKYLWDELAPKTFQNTRDIDKILTRLEFIVQKNVTSTKGE